VDVPRFLYWRDTRWHAGSLLATTSSQKHLCLKEGFFIDNGRVQKSHFFKSPNQWVLGVFWVLLGFLDKQEKIGKIIQKLSNLKP